jgi:hypothetical protein
MAEGSLMGRILTKEVEEFLEFLYSNKLENINVWMNNKGIVRNYFSGLDKRVVKIIFSDKYWIRYPSYKYYIKDKRFEIEDRPFGFTLGAIIQDAAMSMPKLFDVLIGCSSGVILCFVLDAAKGRGKVRAARRARKSEDERARLRAVDILPISGLKPMYDDKSINVRRKIASRIGIHNCAKEFVDDDNIWFRASAVISLDPEDIDYGSVVDDFLKHIEEDNILRFCDKHILKHVLAKIGKEELLYYLDISGNYQDIDDILLTRLENKWG